MKTILVTGTSSGIGNQICIQAAAMYFRVISVSRNIEPLKDLGGIESFKLDITDKDSNAFISSGNDKARTLLQGGGVRSMSLSASGVFTDSSTENLVRGFAFDGAIQNYDLVFSDGSKISGAFLITL